MKKEGPGKERGARPTTRENKRAMREKERKERAAREDRVSNKRIEVKEQPLESETKNKQTTREEGQLDQATEKAPSFYKIAQVHLPSGACGYCTQSNLVLRSKKIMSHFLVAAWPCTSSPTKGYNFLIFLFLSLSTKTYARFSMSLSIFTMPHTALGA